MKITLVSKNHIHPFNAHCEYRCGDGKIGKVVINIGKDHLLYIEADDMEALECDSTKKIDNKNCIQVKRVKSDNTKYEKIIRKIQCFLGFHEEYISRAAGIISHIDYYGCKHCGKYIRQDFNYDINLILTKMVLNNHSWFIHRQGEFLILNDEIEKYNKTRGLDKFGNKL